MHMLKKTQNKFLLLLIFSILLSPFRRSLHEAEQAGGSRSLVQRVPQGQA